MKKQIIDDMEIYSHFKPNSWFQRNELNILKAMAVLFGLMTIAVIIGHIILYALTIQ
jgi:hypothetical protein